MLGCTVFHCMERLCLFNQSCTNGDSSFYKFLLSICYVIDNCAEHCGSAVSRVEIFFLCKEYRAWCRASKQMCIDMKWWARRCWSGLPLQQLGSAQESEEELDSVASPCLMLLWGGQWLMRQSVVFSGWEQNEWPWACAVPITSWCKGQGGALSCHLLSSPWSPIVTPSSWGLLREFVFQVPRNMWQDAIKWKGGQVR